jgi:PTH2 family peptidyl-tRNA hydrolase
MDRSGGSGKLDPDIQAMLDERARTMAEWTADHRPLKIYAIYRADLEMGPNKLAAQCGHAYQLALEAAEANDPTIRSKYKGTGNGTKINMYAKNLGQLLRAYREARSAGLPCALVIDRGHVLPPHFDGQPIITALGIGPAFEDQATPITKRYTMAP